MSAIEQSTHLGATYVAQTVERLEARIRARFPERHLADVAVLLAATVPAIQEGFDTSHQRLARTRWISRAGSTLVVVSVVVALVLALRDALRHGPTHVIDWVPLLESTINDVVFAGIAVFFLWAMPERLERRTLLALLHELRSLAHVVDMHQLDKDPEQARADYVPTAKSPPDRLTAEQLHYYFDYCSELVSLIAKTGALCAEHTSDPVVLNMVSSIERLSAEMSQKIWQKISLLQ